MGLEVTLEEAGVDVAREIQGEDAQYFEEATGHL